MVDRDNEPAHVGAPSVGIFFVMNDRLLFDAVQLEQGDPYGDTIGHGSHYEFWETVVPQTELGERIQERGPTTPIREGVSDVTSPERSDMSSMPIHAWNAMCCSGWQSNSALQSRCLRGMNTISARCATRVSSIEIRSLGMADEFFVDSAPPTWESTTLGDLVKRGGGRLQTGPFGSQLHASDYVPIGVPFIMPVNLVKIALLRTVSPASPNQMQNDLAAIASKRATLSIADAGM